MSNQILEKSNFTDQNKLQSLANDVMAHIPDILQNNGKAMSAEQMEKMSTHVFAMARRSLTDEKLPDFDTSLFDEVSEKSISIARQVVALFENLPDEEALLLSIHFESVEEL